MSGFSDHLENALFNATLRGGSYTGGSVFAALFTSNPTDAGSGTEVTDSAYVRQRAHTTVASDGFTAPNNGSARTPAPWSSRRWRIRRSRLPIGGCLTLRRAATCCTTRR